MGVIYAYFDESGKHNDHPVVSFTGVCTRPEALGPFDAEWQALLRQYGLDELHMVKAVRRLARSERVYLRVRQRSSGLIYLNPLLIA